MNKIEELEKNVKVNGITYQPRLFLNAWDNWCVTYSDILNRSNHLCSVTVEPDNEPKSIEESLKSWINQGIGNARTLDDAVDMIKKYIKDKNYV